MCRVCQAPHTRARRVSREGLVYASEPRGKGGVTFDGFSADFVIGVKACGGIWQRLILSLCLFGMLIAALSPMCLLLHAVLLATEIAQLLRREIAAA